MNGLYEQNIAKTRYARYLPEQQRRETFDETAQRYIDFWGDKLTEEERQELHSIIVNKEVMPSMRCMMTAGEALRKDNVAGFNCAYMPVDHPRAFDEAVYILMCGTGLGFSVERQYVTKLPEVPEALYPTDTVIVVADSKIGWAKAYKQLIAMLYAGEVPSWDISKLRPAGAPLKTFGGRSSGPEPLVELFEFTVAKFREATGRKLNSLECHDIMCKIAQIVVVGGVRRSALISLSNLSDDRMRKAKHGLNSGLNSQRFLANNSAAYTEKPDMEAFLDEWNALYQSYSGERGIFSRIASEKIAARNGRRAPYADFGTNPCSEIILRANQFCNLSECVARTKDTLADLKRKVRQATIFGTLQATLTDFRYLRPIWTKNTAEEALLGVSLTGICDHPVLSGQEGSEKLEKWLTALREVAIETNKEWAARLGIEQSAAITCVKPSGTVSQLTDSASGIHPRFAHYYIRRVRCDVKDPMAKVLEDAGVPVEIDKFNPATAVFSFPKKAPAESLLASEMTARQQLDLWEVYQRAWCEHKPSMTCYYRDKEFLEIGQWIYNNFDLVSGISFLPYSDHVYEQAPYEAITQEEYEELEAKMPKEIEWDVNEEYDATEGAQTLACVAGACEL